MFDRISKKSDQILEDLNSLYQELENEKRKRLMKKSLYIME